MIIHHFFRWCFFGYPSFFSDFPRKTRHINSSMAAIGGFPSEVDPWGVASCQEPFHCRGVTAPSSRGAEQTWKNQMKKNDMFMERYGKNDFFCHKATCFLDELWSTVLLYYCTTTIFMYRVFAIYLVWRRASTRIRPQYLFATLPTDQSNRIPRFRITITLAIRSEFHFKFWGCRVWGYLRF